MGCKSKKYLHIHDWNYWWGYYRCCKDWEPFHAAEFSLSEDEAGKAPFFHFDFHNLPALHQTILDGEFVEPDNPDLPHFLEQARRLRSGEQDWFVGALYLSAFFAGDAFLQRLRSERRPADTAAFPVCTALLRGDLSPGGAPPHSGGADALGGDTVPTPVRPPSRFPVRLHKSPAGRRRWSSLRTRCG